MYIYERRSNGFAFFSIGQIGYYTTATICQEFKNYYNTRYLILRDGGIVC